MANEKNIQDQCKNILYSTINLAALIVFEKRLLT